MIKFEGVHKWFKKLHVLNGIDLHVKQGEVVVVCGPSGSGKSTLIRTINQLEPIEEGSLIVDGMDLRSKKTDINRLRAEVGFVFQQFNLYPHLSVIDNITLAPIKIRKSSKKEAQEQAMELLERVGLAVKRDAYPTQLSGGQQQRVAIARALAKQPALVLADEPTANLDSRTSADIVELMKRMQERCRTTFIFSTHDREIIRIADDIVVLQDGRLQ